MKLFSASFFKNEKVLLTLISFVAVVFTLLLTFSAALEGNAIVLWSKFYSYFIDTFLLLFTFTVANLNQKQNQLLFEFGLGKAEAFAGIWLSFLVILYAVIIIFAVSYRIMYPRPLSHVGFGFVLYILFMIKDIVLWYRLKMFERRNASPLISSQKRYYAISMLTNLIVMLPLFLALKLPHKSLVPMTIDIICALTLCFITVYLSYNAGKRATFDLLDKALDESIQIEILKFLAKHFDLYEQYHGQLTRQTGTTKFIDLFFEFDDKKSFKEIMDNIETIKDDIQKAIPDSRVYIIPTRYKLGEKSLIKKR